MNKLFAKITKLSTREHSWYKDPEFLGAVFEVKPYGKDYTLASDWRMFEDDKTIPINILRGEDCELI